MKDLRAAAVFAAVVLFALAVWVLPAKSQSLREWRLIDEKAGVIPVWLDDKAHTQAVRLLIQNAPSDLIIPLARCLVKSGTPVAALSLGLMTADVIVTSGPHKGCKGNVPVEHLR